MKYPINCGSGTVITTRKLKVLGACRGTGVVGGAWGEGGKDLKSFCYLVLNLLFCNPSTFEWVNYTCTKSEMY